MIIVIVAISKCDRNKTSNVEPDKTAISEVTSR